MKATPLLKQLKLPSLLKANYCQKLPLEMDIVPGALLVHCLKIQKESENEENLS